MDIAQEAARRLEAIRQQKAQEKPDAVKDRMKKVLSRRDEVMRGIAQYQDKTGIPSDKEVNNQFLKENKLSISADDLEKKQSEE